jgi:hypothetical protein
MADEDTQWLWSTGLLDYGAGELGRIPAWDRKVGESQPNSVKWNIMGLWGLPVYPAGEAHAHTTLINFRAGTFYDYFMSVAFWMRPFFTDFHRYGENRKAVDNEWIVLNCAGFERMSTSAFYALRIQRVTP